MESLLQQPPAATVRFVSNQSQTKTHEEPVVKQFIDATSRPIYNNTFTTTTKHSSSSSGQMKYDEPSSSKSVYVEPPQPSSSKPVKVVKPKPVTVKQPEKSHRFSHAEVSAAEKKRQREITQLQTRFCDNISTR